MERHALLEICLVSLTSLPDAELRKLVSTLAALAEPYLAKHADRDVLCRRVHDCLTQHLT